MNVAVVDYGAGNVRSLLAALRRIGLEGCVTRDAAVVDAADHVILPGVGSAASAMRVLRETGVDSVLRDRVARGAPVLGICLGMQLAVDDTEEDGGASCLGLVRGRATRLRGQRVPRMGWARVDPGGDAFYFAHSYGVTSPATVATSEGLAAVLRHEAFWGTQFHPEKSGPAGERFLRTCLSAA